MDSLSLLMIISRNSNEVYENKKKENVKKTYNVNYRRKFYFIFIFVKNYILVN